MTTARHVRPFAERNILWWLLLVALAGMAISLLAGTAWGDHKRASIAPAALAAEQRAAWLLGVQLARDGKPVQAVRQFEAAVIAASDTGRRPEAGGRRTGNSLLDSGLIVWLALCSQAAGDSQAAIEYWNQIDLPAQTAYYRAAALVAAHLDRGDMNSARDALEHARSLDSENPLVEYYCAKWNLAQADHQRNWQARDRLALYRFSDGVPTGGTAGMQVVDPRDHFVQAAEKSLERMLTSRGLEPAQSLLPDSQKPRSLLPAVEFEWQATVGDLLAALGVRHLDASAHLLLGNLRLERDQTEQAEEHFDAAAECGLPTVLGYRRLAAVWKQSGRHADAARAQRKAESRRPLDLGLTLGWLTETVDREPWTVDR